MRKIKNILILIILVTTSLKSQTNFIWNYHVKLKDNITNTSVISHQIARIQIVKSISDDVYYFNYDININPLGTDSVYITISNIVLDRKEHLGNTITTTKPKIKIDDLYLQSVDSVDEKTYLYLMKNLKIRIQSKLNEVTTKIQFTDINKAIYLNRDSIINQLIFVKENTENIQLNLRKFYKQYSIGLRMSVVGFVTTTSGSIIYANGNNGLAPTIIGSILMLTGSIVMIDSHKHIGSAGLHISTNGIAYRFK